MRNVERFGGFEDVPELRIVEELALRVRVDDDALESQLADGAFGFDSRALWILWGNGAERGKPRRIFPDGLRDLIVGAGGQPGGRIGIEDLNAGRGEREDLQIDPRAVHVGDPALTDVGKSLRQQSPRAEPVPENDETGIVNGLLCSH